MKKRILSLFLALLLLTGCAAPAAEQSEAPTQDTTVEETTPATEETTEPADDAAETVEFTDSVGRTVTVPANITKVAVSGPMAQIVLFALCPDLQSAPVGPAVRRPGGHERRSAAGQRRRGGP